MSTQSAKPGGYLGGGVYGSLMGDDGEERKRAKQWRFDKKKGRFVKTEKETESKTSEEPRATLEEQEKLREEIERLEQQIRSSKSRRRRKPAETSAEDGSVDAKDSVRMSNSQPVEAKAPPKTVTSEATSSTVVKPSNSKEAPTSRSQPSWVFQKHRNHSGHTRALSPPVKRPWPPISNSRSFEEQEESTGNPLVIAAPSETLPEDTPTNMLVARVARVPVVVRDPAPPGQPPALSREPLRRGQDDAPPPPPVMHHSPEKEPMSWTARLAEFNNEPAPSPSSRLRKYHARLAQPLAPSPSESSDDDSSAYPSSTSSNRVVMEASSQSSVEERHLSRPKTRHHDRGSDSDDDHSYSSRYTSSSEEEDSLTSGVETFANETVTSGGESSSALLAMSAHSQTSSRPAEKHAWQTSLLHHEEETNDQTSEQGYGGWDEEPQEDRRPAARQAPSSAAAKSWFAKKQAQSVSPSTAKEDDESFGGSSVHSDSDSSSDTQSQFSSSGSSNASASVGGVSIDLPMPKTTWHSGSSASSYDRDSNFSDQESIEQPSVQTAPSIRPNFEASESSTIVSESDRSPLQGSSRIFLTRNILTRATSMDDESDEGSFSKPSVSPRKVFTRTRRSHVVDEEESDSVSSHQQDHYSSEHLHSRSSSRRSGSFSSGSLGDHTSNSSAAPHETIPSATEKTKQWDDLSASDSHSEYSGRGSNASASSDSRRDFREVSSERSYSDNSQDFDTGAVKSKFGTEEEHPPSALEGGSYHDSSKSRSDFETSESQGLLPHGSLIEDRKVEKFHHGDRVESDLQDILHSGDGNYQDRDGKRARALSSAQIDEEGTECIPQASRELYSQHNESISPNSSISGPDGSERKLEYANRSDSGAAQKGHKDPDDLADAEKFRYSRDGDLDSLPSFLRSESEEEAKPEARPSIENHNEHHESDETSSSSDTHRHDTIGYRNYSSDTISGQYKGRSENMEDAEDDVATGIETDQAVAEDKRIDDESPSHVPSQQFRIGDDYCEASGHADDVEGTRTFDDNGDFSGAEGQVADDSSRDGDIDELGTTEKLSEESADLPDNAMDVVPAWDESSDIDVVGAEEHMIADDPSEHGGASLSKDLDRSSERSGDLSSDTEDDIIVGDGVDLVLPGNPSDPNDVERHEDGQDNSVRDREYSNNFENATLVHEYADAAEADDETLTEERSERNSLNQQDGRMLMDEPFDNTRVNQYSDHGEQIDSSEDHSGDASAEGPIDKDAVDNTAAGKPYEGSDSQHHHFDPPMDLSRDEYVDSEHLDVGEAKDEREADDRSGRSAVKPHEVDDEYSNESPSYQGDPQDVHYQDSCNGSKRSRVKETFDPNCREVDESSERSAHTEHIDEDFDDSSAYICLSEGIEGVEAVADDGERSGTEEIDDGVSELGEVNRPVNSVLDPSTNSLEENADKLSGTIEIDGSESCKDAAVNVMDVHSMDAPSPVIEESCEPPEASVDLFNSEEHGHGDYNDYRRAIEFVLRQEKAVERLLVTPDQAHTMAHMPLHLMKGVLQHFEDCEVNDEEIDWDAVLKMVAVVEDAPFEHPEDLDPPSESYEEELDESSESFEEELPDEEDLDGAERIDDAADYEELDDDVDDANEYEELDEDYAEEDKIDDPALIEHGVVIEEYEEDLTGEEAAEARTPPLDMVEEVTNERDLSESHEPLTKRTVETRKHEDYVKNVGDWIVVHDETESAKAVKEGNEANIDDTSDSEDDIELSSAIKKVLKSGQVVRPNHSSSLSETLDREESEPLKAPRSKVDDRSASSEKRDDNDSDEESKKELPVEVDRGWGALAAGVALIEGEPQPHSLRHSQRESDESSDLYLGGDDMSGIEDISTSSSESSRVQQETRRGSARTVRTDASVSDGDDESKNDHKKDNMDESDSNLRAATEPSAGDLHMPHGAENDEASRSRSPLPCLSSSSSLSVERPALASPSASLKDKLVLPARRTSAGLPLTTDAAETARTTASDESDSGNHRMNSEIFPAPSSDPQGSPRRPERRPTVTLPNPDVDLKLPTRKLSSDNLPGNLDATRANTASLPPSGAMDPMGSMSSPSIGIRTAPTRMMSGRIDEGSVALAVLSYLKNKRMFKTADKFQREWNALYGTLNPQSSRAGVIVWEPLLAEHGNTIPSDSEESEEEEESDESDSSEEHGENSEEEESDEEDGEVNNANTSRASRVSGVLRRSLSMDDTLEPAFASGRRPGRRRGAQRSVSFDDSDPTVQEIPRYTAEQKSEMFYDREHLHRMRFDEKVERQQQETEAMLAFMKEAVGSATTGIPSFLTSN